MDILNDMGMSKLSAKVFSKVNYSFKACYPFSRSVWICTFVRPFLHSLVELRKKRRL